MKNIIVYFLSAIIIVSCSKQTYPTNGENIYRTGRNLSGDNVLDKSASRIKFVNSCITCHGKNGDRMHGVSIKFSDLSNSDVYRVPYNDTSFFCFLDHDLKSDGTKANIGVSWKMNNQDKRDLLEYLKNL
jgi:hypothetical protein